MILKKIIYNNKSHIKDLIILLEKNPNAVNFFRYFKNRNLQIIKNHIVTLLLYIDNFPVGYGHIDLEKNIKWLGVMVADNFCGKGYGTKIINKLLTTVKGDIFLSVDKNNISAYNLYTKIGFKIVEDQDLVYIMKIYV